MFYHPHCKKPFFLIHNPDLVSFSLKPLLLVLCQQALLTGPLQVLKGHHKVSPEPSSLLAEQSRFSQPFLISGPFSGLAQTGPSPSCAGSPELDAALQWGLTRAEQRHRIPSLALLPTVLWMQPRTRLAFWAGSAMAGSCPALHPPASPEQGCSGSLHPPDCADTRSCPSSLMILFPFLK